MSYPESIAAHWFLFINAPGPRFVWKSAANLQFFAGAAYITRQLLLVFSAQQSVLALQVAYLCPYIIASGEEPVLLSHLERHFGESGFIEFGAIETAFKGFEANLFAERAIEGRRGGSVGERSGGEGTLSEFVSGREEGRFGVVVVIEIVFGTVAALPIHFSII